MPKKKYVVTLTAEERSYLQGLVSQGIASARRLVHARILLKSDTGPMGEEWTDDRIMEALDVCRATVERVRRKFVHEGLEAALKRKEQRNRRRRTIDGETEAHLVACACSKPPEGRARWTLQLLGDHIVQLGFVQSVSLETVRQTLKKTRSNHG